MSEQMPFISFIIPCHNVKEEHLRECLCSITSRELADIDTEIIIVDDGSASWPDEMIRTTAPQAMVIHSEHNGVSAARNKGLLHSRGIHVQFVDADDSIQPCQYRQCVTLLQQSGADMLLFGSKHTRRGIRETGSEYMLHHNLRGAVWSYVFRRDIAQELSFTDGVAYAEDEEFTARVLLKAQSVVATPSQPYRYRIHPQSATGQKSRESILRRLGDTEGVILRLHRLATMQDNTDRQALTRRTAQLTMDYLYNAMRLQESSSDIEMRVESLRRQGLFPLPKSRYTWKYFFFRTITLTCRGRRLLKTVLQRVGSAKAKACTNQNNIPQ